MENSTILDDKSIESNWRKISKEIQDLEKENEMTQEKKEIYKKVLVDILDKPSYYWAEFKQKKNNLTYYKNKFKKKLEELQK